MFERLSALFESGHQRDIPDLMSDARFAELEAEGGPEGEAEGGGGAGSETRRAAGRVTEAAVLIAITDRPRPGLLLTQRPTTMRDHPGQVAFPGGKIEPGESAIDAALREADEELALDPALVRLIGTSDIYHTGTGFRIVPVLGVVPPDLPLIPHPREVEAWFEVPLEIVFDPAQWARNQVLWRGNMRDYLEMEWRGFRIWGVTAAIISNLSRRVAADALLAQ